MSLIDLFVEADILEQLDIDINPRSQRVFDGLKNSEDVLRTIFHNKKPSFVAAQFNTCDEIITCINSKDYHKNNKKTNHSKRQLLTKRINTKRATALFLLSIGFRKIAIYIARDLINLAIKNHSTHVVVELAEMLSIHYLVYQYDKAKHDRYENTYRKYLNIMRLEHLAKLEYAKFYSLFIKSKSFTKDETQLLHKTISRLSQFKHKTDSEIFHHYYYQMALYYHELINDHNGLIRIAERAIAHYDSLGPEQISRKLGFLSSAIAAYDKLGQHQEALSFISLIEHYQDGYPNKDLCLWRIMNVYLNLNLPDQAIVIFERLIASSNSQEVLRLSNISAAYAYIMKGDYHVIRHLDLNHYKRDKSTMGAHIRIINEISNAMPDPSNFIDRQEAIKLYSLNHCKGRSSFHFMRLLNIIPRYHNGEDTRSIEQSYIDNINLCKGEPYETQLVSWELLYRNLQEQVRANL